jgi:hypothetical protein
MIAFARLVISIVLLLASLAATRIHTEALAIMGVCGLAAHLAMAQRASRALLAGFPIAVFAATVAALQWFAGKIDWTLPLRTVTVFLLSTVAMRIAPWVWIAAQLSPDSGAYRPGLFLLFVRHFTEILISESVRTLQARAMCAPSLLRHAGFSSLSHALAAIFCRAISRAERFYAAQSLNGVSR